MEPEPYEIDQTLVPDAFVALHVVRGRLRIDRATLQARHDLAETLASQVAALAAPLAADDVAGQVAWLRRVLAGLEAEPRQLDASEARWVVGRVAELLDWPDGAVAAVVAAAGVD